jgi:predicted RNA binding protein YcfA (HicA-like mRNA interferase family)
VSPALSDLPVRKITRVLESLGFVYVRTKGSHAVYRHPDGRAVVVPQHGTVKRGTLGSILRQAGMDAPEASTARRHKSALVPSGSWLPARDDRL